MKIKSIRIHQIKGILYPIIDNIWRNQSKSIKTRLFFLQIYQNVVCLRVACLIKMLLYNTHIERIEIGNY